MRDALSWPAARTVAGTCAGPLAPELTPLGDCGGLVLAQQVRALSDLPAFDSSAMDGWAVCGPAPWLLAGELAAGERVAPRLVPGTAVAITTGALLPAGATAVLRTEDAGSTGAEWITPRSGLELRPGADLRRSGEEARCGELLLPAGHRLGPVALGLAASAGHDALWAHRRPSVSCLVLGDELVESGLPGGGQVRDALGVQLPDWVRALGGTAGPVLRVSDTHADTVKALDASQADVLLSSGGTAAGWRDHLRPALRALGAELLVPSVAVRPGHPMVLARLLDGRLVVGLPGNPFAAVAGLLTLLAPLLLRLAGRRQPEPAYARVAEHAVPRARGGDHRLLPYTLRDGLAVPMAHTGPAMFRSLAGASGLLVVPPERPTPTVLEVLALP